MPDALPNQVSQVAPQADSSASPPGVAGTPGVPDAPQSVHTTFTDAFRQAQQAEQAAAPTPKADASAPPQPSASPATPSTPPATGSAPAGLSQDLVARANQLGIAGEFKSDADLSRAVIERFQQIQPLAQYGQQLLAQQQAAQREAQQAAQQQAAPPAGQQPAAPPEEEWDLDKHFDEAYGVPQYNKSWETMVNQGVVAKGESGLWEPTPGNEWLRMSPELRSLNEYESSRSQWMQRTFQEGNFYGNIWKVMQEPIRRMAEQIAEERVTTRFAGEQTLDYINDFERQNATWMYDQAGQPTEAGKKFYSAVDQLRALSQEASAEQILKLAVSFAGPPQAQAASAPFISATPATPSIPQSAVPGQPAIPTQQPLVPPAADALNLQKQQSFLDNALERAKHSPSSGGAAVQAGGEDPASYTKIELDKLFKTAYAAQQAVA